MASLQPEDSHDLYPSCLDLVHLREGLSEDPCMNCSFMPRVAARLAEVKLLKGDAGAPLWKKKKKSLTSCHPEVDQLSAKVWGCWYRECWGTRSTHGRVGSGLGYCLSRSFSHFL